MSKAKAFPRWRRAKGQRRYDYLTSAEWRDGFVIYEALTSGWWAIPFGVPAAASVAGSLREAQLILENAVGGAR